MWSVGGGGKREESGAATGNFSFVQSFLFLERTCGDLESFSWARSHVEPRAGVCELGAEQGGGGPAVLEVTSQTFLLAAAAASAASRPVAGL